YAGSAGSDGRPIEPDAPAASGDSPCCLTFICTPVNHPIENPTRSTTVFVDIRPGINVSGQSSIGALDADRTRFGAPRSIGRFGFSIKGLRRSIWVRSVKGPADWLRFVAIRRSEGPSPVLDGSVRLAAMARCAAVRPGRS